MPGPVAFESEKHAFGHAQGTENAPARQQADLPRSQRFGRGFLNAIVVKINLCSTPLFYRARSGGPVGQTIAPFVVCHFSLEHENLTDDQKRWSYRLAECGALLLQLGTVLGRHQQRQGVGDDADLGRQVAGEFAIDLQADALIRGFDADTRRARNTTMPPHAPPTRLATRPAKYRT